MLKRIIASLGVLVGLAVLAVAVVVMQGCAALSPRALTTDDRLGAFPTEGAPLTGPVTIRWNEWQVPFIEAESDADLAVALGMVHAHLRSAQMELLRMVATGRLSEMVGPIATDIDHGLRVIDFGRASARVVAEMPPETRLWLESFVAGVNHYIQARGRQPPEFGLLGLSPAPWTAEDVITIGRLAGTDVNWAAYFSLLPRRNGESWADDWERALTSGSVPVGTSAMQGLPREARMLAVVSDLLTGLSRSGSNSVAIAPGRSLTGGALIANDPHLGLFLPNLWVLAGMRSPSYEAVGMMIPGVPLLALGRTPAISWGGTNMRAASSDLYDVSHLTEDAFATETQRIANRFWFGRTITVRSTELGPIVTDIPLLTARPGEVLALRWVGHEPSDEISAFLAAMRARTAEDFRSAFEGFAVSAQNLLFATEGGDIGLVLAARQPIRSWAAPPDLVLDGSDPAYQWGGYANVLDLPWILNPESGYVVSANDQPRHADRVLGYFYSPDDRADRLLTMIEDFGRLGLEDLQAMQQDVVSDTSRRLAHALAEMIAGVSGAADFARRLAEWDGGYEIDSRGAVAFETLLYHVAYGLYGETAENGERTVPGIYDQWSALQTFLLDDLRALAPEERARLLAHAVPAARTDAAAFPTWGDMHRLRIGHALLNLPVVGSRFVLDDLPAPGSRETLQKTAHGLVRDRHVATYGAQARHLSDMSDPDANYFVLLGGNDGWLGSRNFADQVALWRDGDYIWMPLRADSVREAFPRTMRLSPPP